MKRTLRVQRRAVGTKKWKTIRTARTSAGGAYTAELTAGAGRWQFRVNVKAGKGGRALKTAPRTVTMTRMMVAAGSQHTCALQPAGTVRCWGANRDGVLGTSATPSPPRPVTVRGVTGVTAIASGNAHTCALRSTGRVVCWGTNWAGQLGDATTRPRTKPVTVAGLTGVVAITAGHDHSCAVTRSGKVTCWGYNQANEPDDDDADYPPRPPWRVPGLSGIRAVASSEDFDCALGRNGRVQCWGDNGGGELGDGTRTDRARPVTVRTVTKATAVATGDEHACAIVTGGRVTCWGVGYTVASPRGSTKPRHPRRVPGLTKQTAITAGKDYTCSVGGGRVRCWGTNKLGTLGDGRGGVGQEARRPILARAPRGMISVSSGGNHTCAQQAAGAVWCWGDNGQGQLGDGTTTYASPWPVTVQGLTGTTSLAASDYTCALVRPGGDVHCWGSDSLFEDAQLMRPKPTKVTGVTGARSLAAGGEGCALLTSGGIRCWSGSGGGPASPVSGVSAAAAVAVGASPCVMESAGTVMCWGLESPVRMPGITRAVALSARSTLSGGVTCALESSGSVWCWSYPQDVPTLATTIPGATRLAVGDGHSCALVSGGTVQCWGSNPQGQLGDGATSDRATPGPVVGLRGVTAISSGASHTCALISNGTVQCWGANGWGQLGNGTMRDRARTGIVAGIRGATAIAAGISHTCAVVAGGRAQCWGDNSTGALGMDLGWTPRRVRGL